MGLLKKFFNQTRKPEGVLGKIMVGGMNRGSHAKLANFGLSLLPDKTFDKIVDLGCGGGRNVREHLKRNPDAQVFGVDYSIVSVDKATKFNKKYADRCRICAGDVGSLLLDKDSFELATAFETIYFWPGLEKCFKNVYDVLKDGGLFLITNESDGLDETGKKFEDIIEGMKIYTANQIEEALKSVGFEIVGSAHHDSKPWIAILAKK